MTDTPESTNTPAEDPMPAAAAKRKRGYFNQAQVEDLELANTVLAAALDFPDEMTDQDIVPEYLSQFSAALEEARKRANSTNQESEESQQATAATTAAAKALTAALQRIQASAKQKHKMLAEDGDPTTNFPLDNYLIGIRLDASRAALRQNATALIDRVKADSLPGFKTAEKIDAVDTAFTNYVNEKDDQSVGIREKELARMDRDSLLHLINTRRSAIQHAADAIWPPTQELTRPIRKSFALPQARALGR